MNSEVQPEKDEAKKIHTMSLTLLLTSMYSKKKSYRLSD